MAKVLGVGPEAAEVAAEELGDDVVLKTILKAAADTLPRIEGAGKRIERLHEKARRYIRAAADMMDALRSAELDLERLRAKTDAVKAAIAKAGG